MLFRSHAERPVTQTEAVPVERVRLGKETVTEHEEVSGEVRKEEIDTSGVESTDRRDGSGQPLAVPVAAIG